MKNQSEFGAQIVVFGAPLVISGTAFQADSNFEAVIRDIVQRVKQIEVT